MDINKKSRADLKAYFVNNAIPTDSDFRDLIDGALSHKDDGITKSRGEPLSIEAALGGERRALDVYESFADPQPAWVLSLLPGATTADPTTGKRGLGVRDGAGNPRLFIEGASGNVGLGTLTPGSKLDVQAEVRTGMHPTGLALYVTHDANQDDLGNGVQFRHYNGTIGIGFTCNTIYATGHNVDQDLFIKARGAGRVQFPGGLTSAGLLTAIAGATVTGGALNVGTSAMGQTLNAYGALNAYGLLSAALGANVTGLLTASSGLDLRNAARIGTHPAGLALYVTGDFGSEGQGVEFRHSNGTQGIGFGYNTIYAAGSDANQDLVIKAKGTGKVNIGVATWADAVMQNSWANYGSGYNNAGYYKDPFGIVHLRGMINNGIAEGENATIFILPAGYRPPNRELLKAISWDGTNYRLARIDVRNDGHVIAVYAWSAWIALDGLTFRAA